MDTRTFYGPHACATCGALICKASREEGGEEFDYPEGLIYPNTVWRPHVHRADSPLPSFDVYDGRLLHHLRFDLLGGSTTAAAAAREPRRRRPARRSPRPARSVRRLNPGDATLRRDG